MLTLENDTEFKSQKSLHLKPLSNVRKHRPVSLNE
uniref:Uncharacterized protein n=1 Tax=Myoviridae sp. ctVKV3 TaxID=2827688 RepID=A0A8S5SBM4_9CAUD|nr:MAG TPA: hypothetical protein [Myoviridae sp. ctVKV3]